MRKKPLYQRLPILIHHALTPILQIFGTKFLPYILSYIDYPFQLTVDALTTRSSFTLSISLPYSRPLHNHKPLSCYGLRYLYSLNKWISRLLPFDKIHPRIQYTIQAILLSYGEIVLQKNFWSKLFYYHPINWFFCHYTKYLLLLCETIFMLLERKYQDTIFNNNTLNTI